MAIAHPTAMGNQQTAQAKKKAITCSSEVGAIVKNAIKILVTGFKFAIKLTTQLPVLLKNLKYS